MECFMMHPFLCSLVVLGFVSVINAASPLAFPEALGFGSAATGGRGGTVYHVTNLDDSGTGSFRDAVSSPNRIVVFDAGGYINLKTAVSISSNITIAGQTAPGEGIGFRAGKLSTGKQSNIIMRYLRIRPGSETASTGDVAINLYNAHNIILDHMSIEFAPWNNIGGVSDDWQNYPVTNITIQYSLIADPIYQQFGAHCESVSSDWSWYYNAFVNSHNRNPLAKTNTVFVNNILYNYEAGYTTHTSTSFKHDIVNNYFIYGPATGGNTWFQVDKNQTIYYSGNLVDTDKEGTLNGTSTTPYWYQGEGTVLTAPWSTVTASNPVYSPATAFRLVTSQSGTLPYDPMDSLIWAQVNSLKGGPSSLYTTQTQTGLDNNGYGTIRSGTKRTDTDNDGMPDFWESATGSNLNSDDAMTLGSDGYVLIEKYINWLGTTHASVLQNSDTGVDLRIFTQGFQAVSPSYTVANAVNGSVTLLSDGYTVRFTPTANYTGEGSFQFTVKGNDGTEYTGTVSMLVESSTIASGPALTYVGPGASHQTILLNSAIVSIAYTYTSCTSAQATNLPAGVTASMNTTDSTITLSGTPSRAGNYTFTITTIGGEGDAHSVTGTITVIPKAAEAATPATILSSVNAAYPAQGLGVYEEKNTGWIDSGYYNFTNSAESDALWNLNATTAARAATLVIRFANGGTLARHMNLIVNGTSLGAAPFASTATWTTWDSVSLSVDLVQGLNTLQLTSTDADGGPNVDQFEFDVAGVTLWTGPTTALFPQQGRGAQNIFYNAAQQILNVPAAGFAEIEVFDLQGRRIAAFSQTVPAGESSLSIGREQLHPGIYWVQVRFNGHVIASTKMVHLK